MHLTASGCQAARKESCTQPSNCLFLSPPLYSPEHISARIPSTNKQAEQFRTCSLISVPPQEAPGSTHLSALIQRSPVLSKTNRCCCPSEHFKETKGGTLSADEGLHLTKTSKNIQKQQNLFWSCPYITLSLSAVFLQLQAGWNKVVLSAGILAFPPFFFFLSPSFSDELTLYFTFHTMQELRITQHQLNQVLHTLPSACCVLMTVVGTIKARRQIITSYVCN